MAAQFNNTAQRTYTEYPTHNERKTMPTKLIVDCSTGITTEVELTAEEIAEREAMAAEYAVQKAQEDADKAAKAAAKESANAKLAALGLTAEEIEALTK
jgi:DNA gyrase inhibitor GyrI